MKLQITLTINPHCCLINSWCSCMNCSFGRHQQPQGDLKVQCLWSYIEFNQFNKTIYMYAKNLKNWNLICKFRILKNIICIYVPPPLLCTRKLRENRSSCVYDTQQNSDQVESLTLFFEVEFTKIFVEIKQVLSKAEEFAYNAANFSFKENGNVVFMHSSNFHWISLGK